jgi:hypothetical protein
MEPQTETVSAPAPATPVRTWTYAWWLVVGALVGLGVMSLLTIGLLFLLAAAVLVGIGVALPVLRNRSVVAIPAGVGLSVLYLAWLNREGPGDVCHVTGHTTRCTEQWSPWPFLAVALVLVAASFALARLVRHQPPAR